ncbi:carbon-nitrogen hydrolase family protein [Sulfitobacter donghicola]|uniref:Amidohydrolase n=1 Tax=Sulfitobacter donghicola DSW-25 = KCTC 12864 = JCM 14565 TaxID=1300350 RepID=A0A073IK38_9RHOB|nr:carbon-nitrogen hydrolase family protein [Sulfitobacter donghicola]KEJ90683.1 amidohydrolase [Sulfitobacter donghicola DSW-25 = KCTC 12864 = JCM 14565]KIN67935.1 Hydrolase, carbon-nitrogen family [Sulfitobacter donghicola DSW-25 = KCTC 12864 = JCM 14565]
MKAAILQLNVTDDPAGNLISTRAMLKDAANQGAEFVLTPEVSNCISTSRSHQDSVLYFEEDDPTLAALRLDAKQLGVWLLIGSLGLKTGDDDGRFANRSFLIDPKGEIVARYDKIHMFDVQVTPTETWKESAAYRPGDRAVMARTPFANIGMAICYDVRFPELFQALVEAGAQILTVPAAFSPVTGAAHWHTLLRARAIETGCFVIAPAQTGTHASEQHKTRDTYGHSLVVAPWGEVILDAGTAAGVYEFELDLALINEARAKVPSMSHKRPFKRPE